MASDEADRKRSNEDRTTPAVDSFAQINTTLLERGCLAKPLDITGLPSDARKALSNLLLSLLAQRQDDATFREQLASKLSVTDSSLERTKRFWNEEQNKSADLTRRLETSKARVGTITQELNDTQAALKRTKEELQKSKRDVLTVKQQINQQKQANERQLERLRSRFSDESIKILRLNVPQVNFASESLVSSTFSASRRSEVVASSLERKQIEELESKRKELIEYNAGLKRFATESLNLAREAANYLNKATFDPQEETASSSSSNNLTRPTARISILYQRDLFPPLFPLLSDYVAGSTKGQKQHPAVESLSAITSTVHHKGSRVLQIVSGQSSADNNDKDQLARFSATTIDVNSGNTEQESSELNEDEHERLLNRALQRVEELEAEIKRKEKNVSLTQSRKEDREERIKQAAEVEKQRQRYLALCKELEKQEELLSSEREALQRQQEEVLCAEMSLSVQAQESTLSSMNESSMMSITSLKRHRDDEMENETNQLAPPLQGKRPRMDQSTPTGNTMRFVTIRKQRGRLQ